MRVVAVHKRAPFRAEPKRLSSAKLSGPISKNASCFGGKWRLRAFISV